MRQPILSMRPILSVGSVVTGLGIFSVAIAVGLASFSLFAMHLQRTALDRVIQLEVAVRNHDTAAAFIDGLRTDVLRSLQSTIGANKESQAAIGADVQEHAVTLRNAVADNAAAPLAPDLHRAYRTVADLADAFTSTVLDAVSLALADPLAGAANYEHVRERFSSLKEKMDGIRDTLGLKLTQARSDGAATANLSRDVIVVSAFFGVLILTLNTNIAIRIVRRITRALASSRAEAHRLSLHDPLTGLPNRAMLAERIAQTLNDVRRQRRPAAMLYLDLDRFKQVNDTLGHACGDALLRGVADRLRANVRTSDIVARLGGDEFAVIQMPISGEDEVRSLAQRLIGAISEPYDLAGHRIMIGASIGVAFAPADTADADELMQMADLALYRAKSDGRGTFCFFERGMDAKLQARRLLEADLRHAVAAGEFELHYQPLVALSSGGISGFEALVRWRHPERGIIPPGEFIPVAEETGLIVPIGAWVLRQACAEAASWPTSVSVAVNVSAVQFRGDHIVAAVFDALAAAGLAPGRLELEITETALLADADATLATLHHLRAFGVRIAMDDFGTGYSSLSYLRSFPFDKIKIDQSFVRDIETSMDCKAIVRAVTGLGENLGIPTTAEGVETVQQLDQLRAEGCDLVQGYYFSRPVPAERVAALLDSMGAHGAPANDATSPNLALAVLSEAI